MKKFVKVLDGEVSNASGIKYKIGEVNIADKKLVDLVFLLKIRY